jgi:hypothetical protein
MALNRNIYDLGTVLKTSIDNNDYIETSNSLTKRSSKLLASSIFPSLSTTGTGSENFYIDITKLYGHSRYSLVNG